MKLCAFLMFSALVSPCFGDIIGITLLNVNVNVAVPGLTPNPNPGTLAPAPTLSFMETPTFATLSLVGGDFDSDSAGALTIQGKFWLSHLQISQDAGFINDVLTISGDFQHICGQYDALGNCAGGPHPGDIAFGGIFNWNFVLDADKAVGGSVSNSKSGSPTHPAIGHEDDYQANAQAAVSTTAFFDDITGWTFSVTASHTPEPSSLVLLAMGIGSLLSIAIKRRKRTFRSIV